MTNIPSIQELRDGEKKKNENFFYYELTDTDELTLTSFFNNNKSIVEGISKQQFLNFDGGTGVSNLDRIYNAYLKDGQQQSNSGLYSSKSLEDINKGTVLLIPTSSLKDELVAINGKNLYLKQEEGQKAYYSERLVELQNDPYYVKKNQITKSGRNVDVQIIEENCQVWVYCKALEKIINVSPFITSLNTNKSDVGSFSFSLNPVLAEDRFVTSGVRNRVNYFDLNGDLDYFTKYLQYNDIVFIRFEKLEIESDNDDIYSSE